MLVRRGRSPPSALITPAATPNADLSLRVSVITVYYNILVLSMGL